MLLDDFPNISIIRVACFASLPGELFDGEPEIRSILDMGIKAVPMLVNNVFSDPELYPRFFSIFTDKKSGFKVFYYYKLVRKRNVKIFFKRLKEFENEYKEGSEKINNLIVRRFRIKKERNIKRFDHLTRR